MAGRHFNELIGFCNGMFGILGLFLRFFWIYVAIWMDELNSGLRFLRDFRDSLDFNGLIVEILWDYLSNRWYDTTFDTSRTLKILVIYLNNKNPSILPCMHPSIHPHGGHFLTTPSINPQQQQQQQQQHQKQQRPLEYFRILPWSFRWILSGSFNKRNVL